MADNESSGRNRMAGALNIFYADRMESGEAILSPDESAHCVRVLRMVKGEKAQVIDGLGGYFNSVILDADPKCCRLKLLDSIDHGKKRDYRIRIAIAPTKHMDRFEWFIEKSVEMGIDIITPLLCQRSERRVLKTDRLQKLIISAMKQAVVPFRPSLDELTDFRELIGKQDLPVINRFIAHCDDTGRKKLQEVCITGKDAVILVGPEGDFSPEEIAQADKQGYIPVSLGPNRLRTETAGMVACHTVNLVNGN